MKVGEFKTLLDRLTTRELEQAVEVVRRKLGDEPWEKQPYFDRYQTKAYNLERLARWALRASPHWKLLVAEAEKQLAYKAEIEPIAQSRTPLPGTRFITWGELAKLPSFPLISRAITYPYTHKRAARPITRDGYVSVAAIYNMSAWSGWKSSSLGASDRAISEAIDRLNLLALMKLNSGRRPDLPAFFPERGAFLPAGNPRRRRVGSRPHARHR